MKTRMIFLLLIILAVTVSCSVQRKITSSIPGSNEKQEISYDWSMSWMELRAVGEMEKDFAESFEKKMRAQTAYGNGLFNLQMKKDQWNRYKMIIKKIDDLSTLANADHNDIKNLQYWLGEAEKSRNELSGLVRKQINNSNREFIWTHRVGDVYYLNEDSEYAYQLSEDGAKFIEHYLNQTGTEQDRKFGKKIYEQAKKIIK